MRQRTQRFLLAQVWWSESTGTLAACAGSAVAVTVSRYQTPAGVDINRKGIQPDIELPEGALPPPGGDGFCSALALPSVPLLFK